jgi:hypothetical protein
MQRSDVNMPDAPLVGAVTHLTALLTDLAGGVFTLVMVYGALRFMLAHNPRAVDSAKSLMGRAAIGLGLVLMVDVLRQVIQFVVS